MTANPSPVQVLFVCLGNICRSPMAEAVFRHLVNNSNLSQHFLVASAGTGGWHAGERPHAGTQKILRENGIDFGDKRAQQLTWSHIETYDYIIAMDEENVADIQAYFSKRVPRLLEYAPKGYPLNVPDPYYNGKFAAVFQLVTVGSQGLLAHIRKEKGI